MKFRKLVLIFAALVVVFAVTACGSSGQSSSGNSGKKEAKPTKQQVAEKTMPKKVSKKMVKKDKNTQVAPKKGTVETKKADVAKADVPKRKMLRLTIPAMKMIRNDTVPTTVGTDEARLRTHAAIHIVGTGFPWEKTANVYIAGHRLGYRNTNSYLAFYDLNNLKKGDKIYITDALGTKYTYKVFRKMLVDPHQVSVAKPMKGKNIVSLQSCSLPDYTKRLIVQGVLEKKS